MHLKISNRKSSLKSIESRLFIDCGNNFNLSKNIFLTSPGTKFKSYSHSKPGLRIGTLNSMTRKQSKKRLNSHQEIKSQDISIQKQQCLSNEKFDSLNSLSNSLENEIQNKEIPKILKKIKKSKIRFNSLNFKFPNQEAELGDTKFKVYWKPQEYKDKSIHLRDINICQILKNSEKYQLLLISTKDVQMKNQVLKIFLKSKYDTFKSRVLLTKEIRLHKKLDHPSISKCLKITQDPKYVSKNICSHYFRSI